MTKLARTGDFHRVKIITLTPQGEPHAPGTLLQTAAGAYVVDTKGALRRVTVLGTEADGRVRYVVPARVVVSARQAKRARRAVRLARQAVTRRQALAIAHALSSAPIFHA